MIEVHRLHISLDCFKREIRGIPRLSNTRKEWRGYTIYLFIRRLRREDDGDEQLERSLIVKLYFLSTIAVRENGSDGIAVTCIHICFYL